MLPTYFVSILLYLISLYLKAAIPKMKSYREGPNIYRSFIIYRSKGYYKYVYLAYHNGTFIKVLKIKSHKSDNHEC